MMWGRWRERKAEREAKQLAFLKHHAELKEAEAKRKPIDEVLDRHARQVKRSDYEGGEWISRLDELEDQDPFLEVRFVGTDPPPRRPHEPTPKDDHDPMLCYLYRRVIGCTCDSANSRFACTCPDYELDEVVVRSLPLPELDNLQKVWGPPEYSGERCPPCGSLRRKEWEKFNGLPEEPVFGWQCRYCGYRFVMLVALPAGIPNLWWQPRGE